MSTESASRNETQTQVIDVGDTDDGPLQLPINELLTGRGFITGKSGSGKSNTASVVAEELLEEGYPLLIVDTDGEYYGLKQEYELLHAGADQEADIQVGAEHAEKLAELALEENVPVILDVSGYLDDGDARHLIRETARHLFAREKRLKRPFLLIVEEIHEYLPEGAGLDDTGQMLIKVAKRGRKHGLGIVGVSQRPADVKKDFITQANWLVWHRLTWENDTDVVRRVVGTDAADAAPDLGDGEALLQSDFLDEDLQRVQIRRKHTFDAGATPDLEDFERPELKSISEDLVDELSDISDREAQRQDEIERLEAVIDEKDERIDELEQDLKQARDVGNAAQQLAEALQGDDEDAVPEDFEAQLEEKNERIHDLEAALDDRDERIDELEAELQRARVNEQRVEEAERIEEQYDEIREDVRSLVDAVDLDVEVPDPVSASPDVQDVDEDAQEHIAELEAENERLRAQVDDEVSEQLQDYEDFLNLDAVQAEIEAAKEERPERYVTGVLAAIIAENGWVDYGTIAERLGLSGTQHVSKAAAELSRRKIVKQDERDDGMNVDLNLNGIEEIRQAQADREKTEQIMEQL